jgi:hypothetical protein
MSMRRARLLIIAGIAIATYAGYVRPRLLRWGASSEELTRAFPGAEIISGGIRSATMAVTFNAPPNEVWPWLVQMGCGRAGWYSWDSLDNGGIASAERIHPEWQKIQVGDRVASSPSGSVWFEVAACDRPHFFALRAALDLRGRPFDTASGRPRWFSDSLWAFELTELPNTQTRIVVSGYNAIRPHHLGAVGNFLVWEPAHWVMQTRQFANLRRRVERNRTNGRSTR